MSLSRREFIKNISAASLVLMGGNVLSLTSAQAESLKKKSTLRFVVASDGHYGQAGTEFDLNYSTIVKNITSFHQQSPIEAHTRIYLGIFQITHRETNKRKWHCENGVTKLD